MALALRAGQRLFLRLRNAFYKTCNVHIPAGIMTPAYTNEMMIREGYLFLSTYHDSL